MAAAGIGVTDPPAPWNPANAPYNVAAYLVENDLVVGIKPKQVKGLFPILDQYVLDNFCGNLNNMKKKKAASTLVVNEGLIPGPTLTILQSGNLPRARGAATARMIFLLYEIENGIENDIVSWQFSRFYSNIGNPPLKFHNDLGLYPSQK